MSTGTARLRESYTIHESKLHGCLPRQLPHCTPISGRHRQLQSMLQQNVDNGELVVPEGSYFALGDNRDDSSDSRYWGFVAAGDFIGRPRVIYDSS